MIKNTIASSYELTLSKPEEYSYLHIFAASNTSLRFFALTRIIQIESCTMLPKNNNLWNIIFYLVYSPYLKLDRSLIRSFCNDIRVLISSPNKTSNLSMSMFGYVEIIN